MATPPNKQLNTLLSLCETHLAGIVSVESYEYTSCYLWRDRPIYDEFGDKIRDLPGNTIYLYNQSSSPDHDLFHELGHVIARKHQLVGHPENGYQGSWENNNQKLIAQVCQQTHWSSYLNLFSVQQEDFTMKAASELWAEIFMLRFLHPDYPEAALIDKEMLNLQHDPACVAIADLAKAINTSGLTPG